jgi:hypothetical protein
MTAEDRRRQSLQREYAGLLVQAYRTPSVEVVSESQLARAGLLSELEQRGIVPVVQRAQHETEDVSAAAQERNEALTYLHLGRLIGASSGVSFSPPERMSEELDTLQTFVAAGIGQQFMTSKLEKEGLVPAFEQEGILPQIPQDDPIRMQQVTERRATLLGYLYIGYQMGTHTDPRTFLPDPTNN